MTALLDSPTTTAIQMTLLGSDDWIREMAKKPDPPKVMKPEKPLPWYAPERHPFLLEMLFKREARSMPREYEAGVSEEKKQRFKRGEA